MWLLKVNENKIAAEHVFNRDHFKTEDKYESDVLDKHHVSILRTLNLYFKY